MSSLFDKPTEVSEMKATLRKLFSPSSTEALPLEKRLEKLPEAELNMILNTAKMVHLAVKGQSRLGLKPSSYLKQTREMYRRLPNDKQHLIAEVLERNDPQNTTGETDTTRDEIIDKTLGEYTAAMATVKL